MPDSGDTAWLLTSAALVLFMTPGLALFYGGMVRAKNVLNMLMQNFFTITIVTVLWVIIGYTLAFGPDAGGGLIGKLDFIGLKDVTGKNVFTGTHVPDNVFMVFQMMFAVITPALITGAIAERIKFSAWVVFCLLWSLIVYMPVAHWAFAADGWIFKMGARDFAGGLVVHINAGIAALACVLVLGPRRGFRREVIRPHNLTMTLLGAGILWFGWFGFNAGSALAANGLAALAFTNTNTAAAAALLTWALLDLVRSGKVTAVGAATGLVVGLVAITPASGYVTPQASIAVGALGALVSYTAIQIRARTRLDDSLDVFSCHGLGGTVGALLTGVFATKLANPAGGDGWLAGNVAQLGVQLLAVLAAAAIAAVGTAVLMTVVNAALGAKAGVKAQLTGLDLSEHGEEAYCGDQGAVAVPGVALGEGVIVTALAEPAKRPAPAV
jgi:Amt family ammonium transporter